MSEQAQVVRPKDTLLSTDLDGFDALSELGLVMRSSWKLSTDQAWRQLDPVRQERKRVHPLAGASGGYVYSAAVSAARSPADYTARVIPHWDGVAIPLKNARIRGSDDPIDGSKGNRETRILVFISSRFVHVSRPDPEIFRLTPDITQVPARQLVYIDTPIFVNS